MRSRLRRSGRLQVASLALALALAGGCGAAGGETAADGAGAAPWRTLGESDFADVNGEPETWVWGDDGVIHGTGMPIGVICTTRDFGDLELEVEWRHLQPGGNSGIFLWVPAAALEGLPPGELPQAGIEIQMLDHGYREQYEARTGRVGDWFTTHGDVFAVGKSELRPFEPRSPDGSRSFPRQELSRGSPEWNHYRVSAVGGEVRLWVNGGEVSGGDGADPRTGRLCLEAEGAPIEFRGLRVRAQG